PASGLPSLFIRGAGVVAGFFGGSFFSSFLSPACSAPPSASHAARARLRSRYFFRCIFRTPWEMGKWWVTDHGQALTIAGEWADCKQILPRGNNPHRSGGRPKIPP